ncbi:MAG: hypothetical protein IKL81_04840 [Clostridia bacterium]|nr:hypothetical protein [Clostridia bacterium]
MTVNISIPKKRFSAKKKALYFLLPILFIFILSNSADVSKSVYSSLLLCAKSVVPALFPMAAVSSFALKTGFAHYLGKTMDKIFRKIFCVSGEGGVAFIVGIIAGYPLGADFTVKLYRCGRISKDEAERLLPFCSNAGAAFIICGIGQAMRGNITEGWAIFFAQLISAVAVGVIMRFLAKGKATHSDNISPPVPMPLTDAFTRSVEDAAWSMVRACSFIMLFSVVISSFDISFCRLGISLPNKVDSLVGGLFEIANGCVRSSAIPSAAGIGITSAIVGWSGLSVIAQSAAIASDTDLSLKKFVIGKAAMSIISGVLGYVFALFLAL